MTTQNLYDKYKDEFKGIISRILVEREAAIPYVISEILTVLLPKIVQDVFVIKNLDAYEKKLLLIEVIKKGIDDTFEELDKLPQLSQATWDNHIRNIILTLSGPILDNLIAVENGELTLNGKVKRTLFCCKSTGQ